MGRHHTPDTIKGKWLAFWLERNASTDGATNRKNRMKMVSGATGYPVYGLKNIKIKM
jgi:hypothetical protein